MKKILLFLLLFAAVGQAQVYNMQNGTFTVSTGMFYDFGGPTGNYLANEDYTITFCPAIPGTYVTLDFSAYSTDAFPRDVFTIYEGDGTDGEIIGVYGAVSPMSCLGGVIRSSDPNGCLTISFQSDNSGQFLGWAAAISLSTTPGINEALPLNSFCESGTKFCADTSVPFPNVTSNDCVPNSSGTVTGSTCLLEAPNPVWHTIKIADDGPLQLVIKQSSGPNGTGTQIDVDFALWGPYADDVAGCGNLVGNLVDCSFSLASQETANIPNAHAGEYYLLLVTNYEGASGYISMQQNGGTGTTDCTVVCPEATKANPTVCGAADGYITLTGFERNKFYNITYLQGSTPVAVTLRSNYLGKIIISGLSAGTYSNILTSFTDCATPIGPVILTETLPVLTNLTSNNSTCSSGSAIYTLTGTPNAVVSYTINGVLPAQTTTLNATGTIDVTVPNITATTTLHATGVTASAAAVTGRALSVSGGENPLNAIGAIAAAGTTATVANSASMNGTNATMVVSLQHQVPAGTAITISLARNVNTCQLSITDGTATQTFNSGTIGVLQRIVFTTAVATNKLTITRIAGSAWIDGFQYSYLPTPCTAVVNLSAAVTISAAITAPIVTTPVIYCRDETPSQLQATSLPGATLNWYGTNPTGGTASATAPTPVTSVPGNVTYYVSQTLGGCESLRSAIVVQVNVAAIAPTVPTTPFVYCKNETASTLTATPLSGAVLHWYGTSATGGTEIPAPTPSTAVPGTFRYYVSQSVSGCESLRVFITVVVNEIPAAPIVTSPVRYCEGATPLPLIATPLTGATLNWYGNNATGGTASTIIPTPQTAITGTTDYYVSQTINGCESPRALIRVFVGLPILPPVPVTPVAYCLGATASALSATALPGASLNWYGTAATGGTDTDIATIPLTATAGSTTYYVSQTVSGCESDRVAIVVDVFAATAVPAVTATFSYCQNESTSILSAIPSPGATLNWYGINATGGTASATAPNPSSSVAGVRNYYVSQTLDGCESNRVAIVVTIKPTPLAPSVLPVVYCQGSVTVALTATAAAGATLNWYGTNAVNGTASINPPTPSAANYGITNYYVSQTVSGCESARVAIPVEIIQKPLAPAVTTPIVYCSGETATALTANATVGATLNWYTTNNPAQTPLANAPTPLTATAGNTTYYVSQTVNGCESLRTPITIMVRASALPTVVPVVYCQYEMASILTATTVSGGTLNWYANQTGGIALPGAPLPLTDVAGDQVFYVSQTIAGCESARARIVVSVKSRPVVSLSDGIICIRQSVNQVERNYVLNAGLDNVNYDFEWTLDGEILSGETRNTHTAMKAGRYAVVAKNRATGCLSEPATAVVTSSFIGESITINGNTAFVEGQDITVLVVGDGIYEYQLDFGPFQVSNVFLNVGSGAHTIKIRDESGCTDLSEPFSIIGYLKFFTPNGDGYNDIWTIPEMESDPTATLKIFDRYGKLMKIINLQNKDWDGTYDGKLLPADDYWFVMEYTENNVKKKFQSHFSLKR